MCRNIKTLFNFDPPATDEEIRAAALQFVRKLSGFNTPSKINQNAFDLAVEQITETGRTSSTHFPHQHPHVTGGPFFHAPPSGVRPLTWDKP